MAFLGICVAHVTEHTSRVTFFKCMGSANVVCDVVSIAMQDSLNQLWMEGIEFNGLYFERFRSDREEVGQLSLLFNHLPERIRFYDRVRLVLYCTD